MKIEYRTYTNGYKHVTKVNGFFIAGDKCAYMCTKCGAIFQSKNMWCRSIFPTKDPKCRTCDENHHEFKNLKRICECEEIIKA